MCVVVSARMEAATDLAVLERLKLASGSATDAEMAVKLNLTKQSVAQARSKKSVPASWIPKAARLFNVSTDWLFFGTGPMRLDAPAPETAAAVPAAVSRTVPVFGLAACGIAGWYNREPIALRVPVPGGYISSGELIAVIAVGTSMQSEGIRQGYLVFCDTGTAVEKGDAVFVEKNDGSSAIKKYIGRDDDWLTLQGWLDPDENGEQKPYTEKLLLKTVTRIVTVVLVQRKA